MPARVHRTCGRGGCAHDGDRDRYPQGDASRRARSTSSAAPLAERDVRQRPGGPRRARGLGSARSPRARTIGIEGSARVRGAARPGACSPPGSTVREVPPQLSRRERGRTRRAGKSDPGDALAIARVTAREADLPPVRLADRTGRAPAARRGPRGRVAEATRVRNRLHAHLRACSSRATAGRSRNLVAARYRRHGSASSCAGRPDVQAELARARLARLARDRSARSAGSRRGSRALVGAPSAPRPAGCRGRSPPPGSSPRPATSGASARPTRSRCWPASRRSRRARDRSSGCASTGAATASSTGRFYTIATVQAAHHPPAQAFTRPQGRRAQDLAGRRSGPSSVSSSGRSSGCSSRARLGLGRGRLTR